MDPNEVNGVYVDEADAEEVVILDNEGEMEVDDGASWVTESDGAGSLQDLEDDDEEEENEDNAEFNPERDDAVTIFQQHTGEVYSVRINPTNSLLVVTGGKDDRAFVWNVSNGEVLFECTGHSDSVVGVDFNCNGTLLATGDMNGVVIIWKVETREKLHEVQASEIQWLKWHPVGNVLMAGTGSAEGNGDIVLWEFPSCCEKYLLGPGMTRCNTGNFFPDGKQAAAGYDSGMVRIWNLKSGDCVQKFRAHSGPVTRLECHPENKILLSASVDGTVCLLHPVNGQILKKYELDPSLPGAMNSSEETNGVNAAAFCPSVDFKFLAVGMESGQLIIWDYTTHTRRAQCQHTASVERLVWDPKGPFVYTCTADAKVCLWDARNGQQVGCWTGHRKGIFDMELSRNGKCLVTVSYDKTARVFAVETPSPNIVASRIPAEH